MFITKPFIKDRKIRFALAGCGRISANHFDALDKHADRAELVGVCDVDPTAMAKAAERTGAHGFKSLDKMLAGTEADIVILSTPSRRPRRAGGAGGGGGPARDDREADGHDGGRTASGWSTPATWPASISSW